MVLLGPILTVSCMLPTSQPSESEGPERLHALACQQPLSSDPVAARYQAMINKEMAFHMWHGSGYGEWVPCEKETP